MLTQNKKILTMLKNNDFKKEVQEYGFTDKSNTLEMLIFDDPKTTVIAIVIPFLTFLGGFLTGKKKSNKA